MNRKLTLVLQINYHGDDAADCDSSAVLRHVLSYIAANSIPDTNADSWNVSVDFEGPLADYNNNT